MLICNYYLDYNQKRAHVLEEREKEHNDIRTTFDLKKKKTSQKFYILSGFFNNIGY